MIVTLPTLGAIRNYFPNARIEVMGYPSLLEIIKGRYYADVVSRFDQADMCHLFMRDATIPAPFMKRLRRMDLIISFVSDKARIFSGNLDASGAQRIVHHDPFPSDGGCIHVIDHLLKSLKPLGISHVNNIPKLFLRGEDIHFHDNFIKGKTVAPGKMLVAIHPGSGGVQKCWSPEKFAALITWLNKEVGSQIFLISGPADGKIVEGLRAEVKDAFAVVDHLPLSKLAAVLERCDLFIGNDSGITHLAAATGVPTLAIFGPTDPKIWGPRGERVKILYKKAHCSPCSADTRRNCFTQICLESIKIEDVMQELKDTFLRR